jgi:hypothetical protein
MILAKSKQKVLLVVATNGFGHFVSNLEVNL